MLEEIIRGESKNAEFKVSLPEKSENYVKTIIAFANSQGGKLMIGIDDLTREVVGVDRDDVFEIMDTIANAVDDSCMPQLIPDIEPQTIDEKTIVVVTVAPGTNRPYYLRSKGKERGTYIRIAGTSRPAGSEKIKELEMEGARISWDELNCVGFPVTDKAVRKLCQDIMSYRRKAGLPKKQVTRTQLANWKVLKETDGTWLATNAFALLTSDHFFFSRTQCAVFKGTERNVFLDKREYSGPLYRQIEEAVDFVLRNIRLSATIHGLLRKEEYELPVEAIREMIVNAHCHRNMLDEACVQVAVYDDRLEVTSPGGLYNGLTYEQMMSGRSRIRNKAIANVFNQMGLIEAWGTGIQKIKTAAAEFGLREPEFLEFDDTFRINLYRNTELVSANTFREADTLKDIGVDAGANGAHESVRDDANRGANGAKDQISRAGTEKESIINFLRQDPKMTQSVLAEKTGLSRRTIQRIMKEMSEEHLIQRVGSTRGYWKVEEMWKTGG